MLRNKEIFLKILTPKYNKYQQYYGSVKRNTYKAEQNYDLKIQQPTSANVYAREVGLNYNRWYRILEKHPELKTVKQCDLINTVKTLYSLKYTIDDILTKPMILYYNDTTLMNRYLVLKECNIININITLLSKFVTVVNKSIVLLKAHRHMPVNLDLVAQLKKHFLPIKLEIPNEYICNENMELRLIRENILNSFLQQHLNMNRNEIEKLWKTYGRIRHRNFAGILDIIELLKKELNFSTERIIKNGFLFYADADNVRNIIRKLPEIHGDNIREILYKRPKIMMSTCDTILEIIKHIKSFGIGEDAIIRCLDILTLSSDTVLGRLRDLNDIEEFKALQSNPRILRIVHYQNKARTRLEYLNQLKVRCASLHILSCGSVVFERFARDGSDRTKGRDVVVYLSHIMGKDEHKLRELLSRHPNWCNTPVTHVKKCYEFLSRKNFAIDDIFKNIHLLLYPLNRIEQKLDQIKSPTFLDCLKIDKTSVKLSNPQILTLILYLIENDFHFTGDGVWTDDQHTHQVENFNNLLLDFPNSTTSHLNTSINNESLAFTPARRNPDFL